MKFIWKLVLGGGGVKRMAVLLLCTLLLAGCMGDFLGKGKAKWRFRQYELDGSVGGRVYLRNVGRRSLGVASLVGFAMCGDEVLATDSWPFATMIPPHKEISAGFLFEKEDVPGITHIKIVISHDVFEPLERLTDEYFLIEI